ncbi:MAG: tandem-95 repeat protein, partial [Bacteroidia bacterium]|nr:tandem-95 repeat protein [Bacteroidia bacterium]
MAEVLIDLDGTAGFQQGTEDILLTQNVTPGMNCFLWDGLDGLGGTVDTNLSLDIEAGLISGITHLPLWDAENNIGGLDVDLVRPTNATLSVFYDDSNFHPDSLNLEGDASPGHAWAGNYGESRTINTWWYAFKDTSGFNVAFGDECDCGATAPDTAKGTAFMDGNINGTQDSLEVGINNVLVILYEDIGSNGLLDPTDILTDSIRTDSNGDYEFIIPFTSGKNYIILVDTNTFPTPGIGTSSDVLTLAFSCAGAIVPGKNFGWITLGPPIAIDDTYIITANGTAPVYVLNNDTDPENNIDITTVSNTGLTGPANGTISSIDPVLGIVNYIPNLDYVGEDSLQYLVCDYTGLCDTAWVNITVVEPDTVCSSITNDTLFTNTNPKDTSFTWTVSGGGVIVATLNDTMIVVDWTGATPGNAQVCVVSNNGCGSSATQCLTTYIQSCNEPPVAVDDTVSTNEDTSLVISMLLNDSDPDNNLDTSATVILLSPSNGAATVDTVAGVINYTPNLNFNGQDTLSYIICDDFGLCDTAIVFITVDPVNDLPIAIDDADTTPEDTPITIDVQANDSDLDGDALTTTILSGPSNGTAVVVNGDSITYTPNANFNGNDTLTYVISDGNGGTDTAIVVITVDPINDAPVAVDDTATTDEDTPVTVNVQANDSDLDGDA